MDVGRNARKYLVSDFHVSWRAPFQKGLGQFFMKVDVFGLIYWFWVALFAKTNEKKIIIGKWLKMQHKNEFCSKRG